MSTETQPLFKDVYLVTIIRNRMVAHRLVRKPNAFDALLTAKEFLSNEVLNECRDDFATRDANLTHEHDDELLICDDLYETLACVTPLHKLLGHGIS